MVRMSIAPPSRIVQTSKESNDFCTIDCNGATAGGFLTIRGFPTGYFYTAKDSIFTICKYGESLSSAREIYRNNYGQGTMVVSAAYFRLNQTSEAVLVMVHQPKTKTSPDYTYINCISLKSKRMIKSCLIVGKYNHLEVCIDGCQLNELFNIKEGLRRLDNILVIGGENSSAYLVSLGPIQEVTNEPASEPPAKRIALLKPDRNGFIEYRQGDGSSTFEPKNACVKSLCYMSQRFLIAIGMSNGIIYFVSLKSGICDSLYLGYASVEKLVYQHPLNDSDSSIFLWAQLQHREATYLILASTLPNEPENAERILFIPRFSYVVPQCDQFLTLRSIVLNHQQARTLGNSDDDADVTKDSSFAIRESSRFNQLMLFLYIERSATGFALRGSVFDLDGYYSRRMPSGAQFDRTPAQQCAFLSHFRAESLSLDAHKTIDFLLNDLGRFVPPGSLGTLDQHFYPSSLYFTFYLLSDKKAVEMRVPCLQDQVVNDVSKNFLKYYQSPNQITQFLHGVGLCNSLANENESVMRTCLFRVLLHNYFPGCMNFLRSEEVNEDMLHFVHKWLGKEVEITKARFDEETKALFSTKPTDLPKPALLFANHSQLVFRRASQLFDVIIDRFSKLDIDEEVMQRLKMNKKICEDLLLQVSAILFGSHVDLLRDTPENIERFNKLRLGFAERQSIASRLGIQLEIYKIFDDIIQASHGLEHYNELFGCRSAYELYPPDSFTELLDVLPHFHVNLSAKLQIFGYFTKDLDHFAPLTNQKQTSFDIACGFLLNDNLTSEAMGEMLTAWNIDMRLLRINQMRDVPGMDALRRLSDINEGSYTEEDLKFMPCVDKKERDKLLELYGRFPNGVHKFNLEMISRRRFEMVVDPPAQIEENEAEEVVRARNEVARIKRDFAHLFVRNSFDKAILDKCREEQNRRPHITIKPAKIPLQIQLEKQQEPSHSKVFTLPPSTPVNKSFSLFPNTSSTPHNANGIFASTDKNAMPPPSPYINHEIAKLLKNSAMKRKEIDRLNLLTTPQSVRTRRERLTRKRPMQQPEELVTSSILRDSKKSCLTSEQRNIKFFERKRVHIIPSNYENRELQQAETSFTQFAALDESSAEDLSFLNETPARLIEEPFFDVSPAKLETLSEQLDESIVIEETSPPQSEEALPVLVVEESIIIEETSMFEEPQREKLVDESSSQKPEASIVSSVEEQSKHEDVVEKSLQKPEQEASVVSGVEEESKHEEADKNLSSQQKPEQEASVVSGVEEESKHEEADKNLSSQQKPETPSIVIDEEDSLHIDQASPKRRGRPRKSGTPAPVDKPAVEEPIHVEEASPKRVLRPRKSGTPAPVEKSAVEEPIHIEEALPKRVLRPRKSATPAPVEKPVVEEASPKRVLRPRKSATPAPVEKPAVEEASPKRVLRPRKSATPAPVEKLAVEEASPKRRGRPRKSETPAPVEKPVAESIHIGEASPKRRSYYRRSVTPAPVEKPAVEEASPKRRGRPRKSESVVVVEDDEPVHVEASPKRRGRPRKSETAAVAEKSKEKEASPKRSGQSKKSESPSVVVVENDEPMHVESSPKRRGRPRKSEAPAVIEEPKQEDESSKRSGPSKNPESPVVEEESIEQTWLKRNLRLTPQRKRRTRATTKEDQ